MTVDLLPGFADPVRDSQSTFRAVLDAMAHPGRIQTLEKPSSLGRGQGEGLQAPKPLAHATAALLLTLVDNETPLWLDARASEAAPWIAFHCGAPLVSAANAQFAVALEPPPWEALDPGDDEEPERAATLILQIDGLGDGLHVMLDGPGLAAPTPFAATLPPGFLGFWQSNHRLFPRGIDVILAAGDRIAALPRTVRMEPV